MSELYLLGLVGIVVLSVTVVMLTLRVRPYHIYWTTRSIPELAQLPPEERLRVWRKCKSEGFRHWQTWVALIVFGLCIIGGPVLTGLVIWPQVHGSAFLGALVGGSIGGFVLGQVRTSIIRPYIRAELQSEQASGRPDDS